MQTCSRCILPIKEKEIIIDDKGICEICNRHDKKWKDFNYKKSEDKLKKILDYFKELNNKFDCIVPLSGGKDSTFVLYILRKKFNLRTLAVNYDNGFQTPQAISNMKKAITKLGSEFVTYSLNWNELRALIREYALRTGGDFCAPCCMGVSATVYRVADQEQIPLIVFGYSPKLENTPIFGGRRYCREKMVRSVLKGVIPDRILDSICYDHYKRRNNFTTISLFDYLPYIEKDVESTLENELGWEKSKHGSNKADCSIFPFTNYFKKLKNGYGRLTIKNAALVRDGQLTREQALDFVQKNEAGEKPPEIDVILEQLSITQKELEESLGKNRLQYIKPITNDTSFLPLKKHLGSTEEKAQLLIDIIRPEVHRDGGDIKYCGINNGLLQVSFSGDCNGCFLQQVMINYLDTLLLRFIPELKGANIVLPIFTKKLK